MNKLVLKLKWQWEAPILISVLIGFIISFWLYPQLPQQLPTHWNFAGEVDGWSPKVFGAFFAPTLSLGLYLLFILLPNIDPKSANYSKFETGYNAFRLAFHLFLLGLHLVVLSAGLGYAIDVGVFVKFGIGLLFIVLGNYMPQFRHNYFTGIKTPWTISNQDVWQKTHRISGRIWVVAGIICCITAFLNNTWSHVIFFLAVLGAASFSMLYSYILYAKDNS